MSNFSMNNSNNNFLSSSQKTDQNINSTKTINSQDYIEMNNNVKASVGE